jgi:SAM-dependent methyltransferase
MDIRNWFPAHEALARLNARHPWSHNEYFHRWILRNLPAGRDAAVDIGCGKGVLAERLATRFTRVTGIDPDEGMAATAAARLVGVPGASIRRCRFDELAPAAGDGGADLITMVAVLHWLDLDDALARLPALLAPGGRLLVVGLARPDSLADLAFDVVSGVANPVMGMIRHPRPVRPSPPVPDGRPVMPVTDPVTTFAEIRTAARARLPGVAIRRRVFFRYTLRWDKPQEPHALPQEAWSLGLHGDERHRLVRPARARPGQPASPSAVAQGHRLPAHRAWRVPGHHAGPAARPAAGLPGVLLTRTASRWRAWACGGPGAVALPRGGRW